MIYSFVSRNPLKKSEAINWFEEGVEPVKVILTSTHTVPILGRGGVLGQGKGSGYWEY